MSKPVVKICGIEDRDTAHIVEISGADMIGFVFAKSNRQILPNEAKDIIASLTTKIKTVGVFVNSSVETIKRIVLETGIDYVQLHGEETVEDIIKLNLPTIKAITVRKQEDLQHLKIYDTVCDYLLVDGPLPGSGETFDWSFLSHLSVKTPIILAGGLSLENINQAKTINTISGFDVSSGVETNGQKDHQKIKDFITKAKGRNHDVSTT